MTEQQQDRAMQLCNELADAIEAIQRDLAEAKKQTEAEIEAAERTAFTRGQTHRTANRDTALTENEQT